MNPRPVARWRALEERRRWFLVVAVVSLLLAGLNFWWVVTFRQDHPFHIDEAGYMTFALLEHLGIEASGFSGWWDALLLQAPHAPLLPGLTSLTFVFHVGLLQGFALLGAFFVLLVLAVYGIGERLAGPRLGALAALVVATAPGAFHFSREFIFAMPAAALLATSVYCLLRTEGLRMRRWAVALGIALGLMLLARAMTIAFVPGVLAAAVTLAALRAAGDLRSRLLNLGIAVAVVIAVAAPWYVPSFDRVSEYLTGYGYGSESASYGEADTLFSLERLREPFRQMTRQDLYLPLAMLLLAGALVVVVALARRRLRNLDVLAVAIVVGAGYAALCTSQNGGFGFTFPLAVLLPTLAVVALRLHPRAGAPALAALAVVATFNVVAQFNVASFATQNREGTVPGLGSVRYAGGVPFAVGILRAEIPGPEDRFDEEDDRWLATDRAVADRLFGMADSFGVVPMTAFGAHSRILNTNTIQLAAVRDHRRTIPLVQLRAEPSDSVASYRDQLDSAELFYPQVLLTMSRVDGSYAPVLTQDRVEEAARQLGFRQVGSLPLPDGRALRIWRDRTPDPRSG